MSVSDHNQSLTERFSKSIETRADGSAAAWVSGVRTLMDWCNARGLCMDDCTRVQIDDYLEFIGREYIGTTAGTKLDAVKHFYDWCSRKELCDIDTEQFNRADYGINTDTTRQARALRQKQDYIAIPREEVMKIANNVPSPKSRNEALIRLLWNTGMRTSEIIEIRVEDIDFDEQAIQIHASKTDEYRRVWYGDTTDMVLREWVDIDRETIGPYGESPYLFLTSHSEQMRSSHVSRIVKESAIEAGLNEVLYKDKNGKQRWKITGHTLRHSMASHHANVLETPIHHIKEMLGHSKLETTEQYVRKDEAAIRRNMQQLD